MKILRTANLGSKVTESILKVIIEALKEEIY